MQVKNQEIAFLHIFILSASKIRLTSFTFRSIIRVQKTSWERYVYVHGHLR